MPQPHHRQATKGSTKSHGSNRTCVEMGRLKACRRVAWALERGGNGSATGTSDVGHRQERVMPKPHRRQATGTAGVSVSLSLAHNGLARLKSDVRGDGALEGVQEGCSGARLVNETSSLTAPSTSIT